MRRIDKIIIHCSATPGDMDIGAAEIRDWHVNDNGWADIGYHHVIRRNGVVEPGRPEERPGAHCANHNASSVGACLVGGAEWTAVPGGGKKLGAVDNFTVLQWESLRALVRELLRRYPGAVLLGHRDLDPGKECPSFSVRDWARKEGVSLSLWPGRTLAERL